MRRFVRWMLNRSVHTKIATTIILVVAFFGVMVTVINIYTIKTQTDKIVSEFIELNLKSNEDFMVKSVLAKDYWAAYKFLKSMSGNGFIDEIGFIDEMGIVIAHTDTATYHTGDIYEAAEGDENGVKVELKSGLISLGYYVIRYKTKLTETLLMAPMLFNIALFLLAAVVSVLFGALITRRILGRLTLLVKNAEALSEKRWDDIRTINGHEQDEITQIVDTMAVIMNKTKLSIRHEEELKDFYHNILSTLDLFVLIVDKEFNVIYKNNHQIGENILERASGKIKDEIKEKLKSCLDSNSGTIPCSSQSEDQYDKKKLLILTHLVDDKIIITFTDVTKIHELEHHLSISRSLSMVGEISATFTHEIKNLLQPAKLLLGDLNRVDQNDLEVVASIITKIDQRVISLLRAGRSIDVAMSTEINCREVVEKVLFILSMQFEEKRVRVERVLDEDITVFLAQQVFESILLDLLINAIEAVEIEGNIRIEVGQSSNNMSLIRIEDDGSGIAEDIQDKIFEPFFSTKETGSGVGLFGVYRNVYRYGGFIDLQSRSGYTKFDIYLPSKEQL